MAPGSEQRNNLLTPDVRHGDGAETKRRQSVSRTCGTEPHGPLKCCPEHGEDWDKKKQTMCHFLCQNKADSKLKKEQNKQANILFFFLNKSSHFHTTIYIHFLFSYQQTNIDGYGAVKKGSVKLTQVRGTRPGCHDD